MQCGSRTVISVLKGSHLFFTDFIIIIHLSMVVTVEFKRSRASHGFFLIVRKFHLTWKTLQSCDTVHLCTVEFHGGI